MLEKIHRLFLKFVERDRKFTFLQRHPQLSFLSMALLLGAFACQSIAQADNPAMVNAQSDTANTQNYLEARQIVFPALANAESLPLYGAKLTEVVTNSDSAAVDSIIVNPTITESETIADSVITEVDPFADATDGTESVQPILDIPFDAETQQRILDEACAGDLRMFCLAMTMAKKESEFVPNLIGDNGLSYGHYQIKTDSHADRIAKYGFTNEDLFDPVKGAIVCVDYLRELLWTYQGSGEVGHFLFMMYNQGPRSARNSVKHMVNSTDYSRKAMSIYESYLEQAGLESGVPIEP